MNKKLIKSIVNTSFFIILSILLLSFTFAWFVNTKISNVGNIDTNVSKINEVYISRDQSSWTDTLTIYETITNLSEYSGNGRKLYSPIMGNKQTINGYYEAETKKYADLIFYIKIKGNLKVLLGGNSSITPIINGKEGIAGAVRVSIIDDVLLEKKPIIWAPNSTYELNNGNFNAKGNPEASYSYVEATEAKAYLSPNEITTIDNSSLNPAGFDATNNFIWGDINSINNYENIVTPIIDSNDFTEVVHKFRIRVWIEGTDREAKANVIGGKFKMAISFNVVKKEASI